MLLDVHVKLEAFNPGSSVKDRIALSMIETAEQEGFDSTRCKPLSKQPVEILELVCLGLVLRVAGCCHARNYEC